MSSIYQLLRDREHRSNQELLFKNEIHSHKYLFEKMQTLRKLQVIVLID